MKNMMAATIVASGAMMVSGAAMAAEEGLKLKLSGWFSGVIAVGDDGNVAHRNISFQSWNSEIHFTAEGTTAGGITYGFRVELEGSTQADQIDESYLYFSGDFGRIIYGNDDVAAFNLTAASPTPDKVGVLAVNYPDYWFGSSFISTYPILGGDSNKFIYFTPRIAGLQGGISYAPDICEDQSCNIGNFEADNNGTFGSGQQVSGGLNYLVPIDKAKLMLSGTYTWTESEGAGLEDIPQLGFGASLSVPAGIGEIRLGGSYLGMQNARGVKDVDVDQYEAGLRYDQGPWTLGVQSAWLVSDLPDADTWAISVGGGYGLAPGLDLSFGYLHYDRDTNVGFDADVVIGATKVSF